MSKMQRKKGPPSALTMPQNSPVTAIAVGDPADSDHASPRPRSLNKKKLSLTGLSSAHSSTSSLSLPLGPQPEQSELHQVSRPRRPSVVSLPPSSSNPMASLAHDKERDGDVPYSDGPLQIIPGIWLGSEDNARDWKGLIERGIKSILNVAKEVVSPFESVTSSQTLRSAVSTPNLNKSAESAATYHPPNPATGRPGLHYLKLQWSHGQQNLVNDGFPSAMAFTDEALQRGEGVLIHCQCGISRSATMTIALVMRAAAERSPSVPSEIWALKGMQPAYDFVKEKSKWIGPNMSLIYQLLDYERKLKGSDPNSPSSDRSSLLAEEEAEWSRRRQLLDEASDDDDDHESRLVQQEAQALDKAMEDRIVARKASASSIGSGSTGVGMGAAWRSRYSRKRAGSVASNTTNGSVMSEDLVEEEEEEELLGVGGGFESDSHDREKVNDERARTGSLESTSSSASNSPENTQNTSSRSQASSSFTPFTPKTARPRPPSLNNLSSQTAPPSAPVWKTSFGSSASLPPPATAFRSTFDLSTPKANKRRPVPLGTLAPVPPSPIAIIVEGDSSSETSDTEAVNVPLSARSKNSKTSRSSSIASSSSSLSTTSSRRPSTSSSTHFPSTFGLPSRMRTESRRPAPPPLHLRHSVLQKAKEQTRTPSASSSLKQGKNSVPPSQVSTPSQTLFVFPPSPTLTTRTPSTMTLTSASNQGVPFPTYSATPRVSTFRGAQGKTRSFIGLGAPPTPTTGFSRVDAKGYVGLQ